MKGRAPSAYAVALALIALVGAALRLYRIGELPPGLYRDEAFYGLDALGVLAGEWSLYFVANNGREGLFIYLLAPSVAALGRTPEALRLVSALVGTLTVLALYAAGRAMFSPQVGLIAAAVLATTFWHLALSRVAFRAITLPLVVCLAVALWFSAKRAAGLRQSALFAAAGVAFGLAFYTYTAAPLVAGLFVPAALAEHRQHRTSLLFWVGASAALAPLAIWLAHHADLYVNRQGQVSIFNPAIHQGDLLGALTNNAVKTLGMFFIAGDRIWRHNLPSIPVFPSPLALLFVLGVVVAVRRWRRQPHLFLLTWAGLFLVPTFLAEDAPHYLRAVGTLPAACLLVALGAAAVIERLSTPALSVGRLRLEPGAWLVVSLGLLPHFALTSYVYFGRYAVAPPTAYWLEAHNVALARGINEAASGGEQLWVDKRLSSDNPALHFLSPALAYVADMGTHLWLPGDNARGRLWVDPNHDWSALRDALPRPAALSVELGPLAQADRDAAPRRAFIVVHFSTPLPPTAPIAQFEHGIRLLGADATCPPEGEDDGCQVVLSWQAEQPRAEDFAVFVHWLRAGQLIAQSDGTPGLGHLPVYFWRAEDRIDDAHTLRGARWQPGDAIAVGLYRRQDLARLRVLDARVPATDDSVIITSPESR